MVQKWPNDDSSIPVTRSGGTEKAESTMLQGTGIGSKPCPMERAKMRNDGQDKSIRSSETEPQSRQGCGEPQQ